MAFLGVYRAIYDYIPVGEGELALTEGDLLLILEKSSEDNWWKAKRKSSGDDGDEPEGLIPNNYVEEAEPISQARALYDYSRQTDEEVSFTENTPLEVYDTTDPDWTLVGHDGDYGFAPSNYIEFLDGPSTIAAHPTIAHPTYETYTSPVVSPLASPEPSAAATLAGLIHQKTGQSGNALRSYSGAQYTPEASENEEAAPSLPSRPMMMSPPITAPRSPEPPSVMASRGFDNESSASQGGFHLYNVHEMIAHMGRKKKLPTTLGLNLAKGIIMISPDKAKDGPGNQWTAEKLSNYSIEGKHVFIELVKPSKSIDFHAGSKDTAEEITRSLGELAGAARAEGLREVIAASNGSGQKKGQMLYEFMAQGEDEVTVAVGDEVIVIDDTASDEWWMVKRLKNGKQGVVPSSYVEITGTTGQAVGRDPTRSVVELNRADEQRLTKEATSRSSKQERSSVKRRESRSASSTSKTKPDPSRTRTWTDTSGTFKVEAEFLGFKDGKIHLHKINGVKIAVPVGKMSLEDIEYVERETGQSLDDDKPLSEIKKRGAQQRSASQPALVSQSSAGAKVERLHQSNPESKYDWFDFFLQCGVNPQICERYAANFDRDEMGEENMKDIQPQILRTLGVKEGDILRVMKFLDTKFGRTQENGNTDGEALNGDSGGLFSGPGGELRNNTRKGRPAPAVETPDTVDGQAFHSRDAAATHSASAPAAKQAGFDDDAWDVKPSSQQAAPAAPPLTSFNSTPAPVKSAPIGALSDLSLLSPPLEPAQASVQSSGMEPPLQPQPTGADRSFFDGMSQQLAGAQSRQRPYAPSQPNQGSFLPPPSSRPQSAPQNFHQSSFAAPLAPQMTDFQGQPAPAGQSMNEQMQRLQMQQRYNQMMQAQQTGFGQIGNGSMVQPTGFASFQLPQATGFGQFPLQPQPTGFQPAPYLNGQQTGSPFADPPRQPFPPQLTGFRQSPFGLRPQPTGVNAFLPPALQPQPTGINGFQQPTQPQPTSYQPQPLQPQQTGYLQLQPQVMGFQPISNFGQTQMQQQAPAPLIPQQTGPAPPVRFGMSPAQKLMAQPTGRRANLASATPQNPFGF